MSTTLNSIAAKLADEKLVKGDTWPTEMEQWGINVALYRDYVDGKHRLELTDEMAKMLRIEENEDERFSINYADAVVNKMADRINIEHIDSTEDTATAWVAGLLQNSQFDELQVDVTGDMIGDGDTFVIIAPPKDDKPTRLIHEPTWDNVSGIIPVYDANRELVVIVKVWQDIAEDKDRVNFYYDDRIEKYIESGSLEPFGDDPVIKWVDKSGEPLGIPFGHFRNRKKTRSSFGKSEVQKIIAPQDVLNRTFVSMTMTAELTAFQRLVFIGMKASPDISPGAVWEAVAKDSKGNFQAGIPNDRFVDVKVITPGEITQFVNQAQFTIEQISVISDTPIPSVMGGDVQSGEALKQREVGLVAKVKTAQVVMGNVWKNVISQARLIEETFAAAPPAFDTLNIAWADATIRDTAQIVTNVMAASEVLDEETTLKELEPAMDYSTADIDGIMEAKRANVAKVANTVRRQATLIARNNARNIPAETPEVNSTAPPTTNGAVVPEAETAINE